MSQLLTVEVTAALPSTALLSRQDINPDVTAVEWSSQDQGGDMGGRVGFMPREGRRPQVSPFLPEPVMAQDGSVVRIRDGDHVLSEGVLTRVLPNGTGLEFSGFGMWASRYGYVGGGGTSEITSGIVAREAIRSCAPWLAIGTVVDAGTRYQDWSAFSGRSADQVLAQLCDEGGVPTGATSSVRFMFLVYDRLASFVSRYPTDRADWEFSYDPTIMDIGYDYSAVVDGVRAKYTDTTGLQRFVPAQGWLYRPGVDANNQYLRRETLTASFDSASQAEQFIRTYRDEHAGPTLSGTLALQGWEYRRMRAGETVVIEGYGELGSSIITNVSVNGWTDDVQVTLGEPPRGTAAAFFQQSARVNMAAQHKLDAVSLNPARE